MTELERRALLGDKQAQEECTRQGVMLPCPFCGGEAELKHTATPTCFSEIIDYFFVVCKECGCKPFKLSGMCLFFTDTGKEEAKRLSEKVLLLWNTRPAPPIGRCGACKHWYEKHYAHGTCATEPTKSSFYCGDFEPKEDYCE